jgi:hypothetical protein
MANRIEWQDALRSSEYRFDSLKEPNPDWVEAPYRVTLARLVPSL